MSLLRSVLARCTRCLSNLGLLLEMHGRAYRNGQRTPGPQEHYEFRLLRRLPPPEAIEVALGEEGFKTFQGHAAADYTRRPR